MNDILNEIQSKIKSKISLNHDMSTLTWFRAGGKASGFVVINDISDLKTLLSYSKNIKNYIIGVGSNLLVRDNGFNGIIIRLGKSFNKIKIKKDYLSVGAGVLDSNLSKFALKNSIKDFEFFSGIPGSIGGAIKMNAGCYGSQTADRLKSVLIIDQFGKIKLLSKNKLNLKYRSSQIDEGSIILQGNFQLKYCSQSVIIDKIKYIKNRRKLSQPLKEKTSGSTFKNPEGYYAAALIEKAGCKDMIIGEAKVSSIHSNFIINTGNATASDIEKLGKKIINKVKNKFGINLEWEIKIIGS